MRSPIPGQFPPSSLRIVLEITPISKIRPVSFLLLRLRRRVNDADNAGELRFAAGRTGPRRRGNYPSCRPPLRPLLSTPALKLAYDRLDSLGADFEVSREATLSTDYPIAEKRESFIQSS
jgi:hypothetical protein